MIIDLIFICRADVDHCIAQRISNVKDGQLCCALFIGDNHWHRAQVVHVVSLSRVSSMIFNLGYYYTMHVFYK